MISFGSMRFESQQSRVRVGCGSGQVYVCFESGCIWKWSSILDRWEFLVRSDALFLKNFISSVIGANTNTTNNMGLVYGPKGNIVILKLNTVKLADCSGYSLKWIRYVRVSTFWFTLKALTLGVPWRPESPTRWFGPSFTHSGLVIG